MERLTETRRKILKVLARSNGGVIAVEIGHGQGIKPGTLYPALRSLVDAGLVRADWVVEGDDTRPRKEYRLTAKGVPLGHALVAETVSGTEWRNLIGLTTW